MKTVDPRDYSGITLPNWLLPRTEISPGGKLLYGRIAHLYRPQRNPMITQARLALDLGVTDRTIRSYLQELLEHRLLHVKRPNRRIGNQYIFLEHDWMRRRFLSDRKDYSGEE